MKYCERSAPPKAVSAALATRHAQLLAHHVDADGSGGAFILRDGVERGAPLADVDEMPDDDAEHPGHERDSVEVRLLGKLQRVPGVPDGLRRHAERAAGDVARRDDRQQRDLAQRQRDEREVMADDAQAKARIADDEREKHGDEDADRDAEPGRKAGIVPQQGRDIGADTEKRAMAERDEAEFPHERPGRVDEAPKQDLDRDVEHVIARRERHERQEERRDDERGEAAA